MTVLASLADRIEDLLPQTQCTKCGYDGCRPYAQAIADGSAGYNQCPPGGAQGVARLAALLGKPVIPLNPANGAERPRPLAVIDENVCIGCTLCMQACPVDAIVGAPKQMHTVVSELCTGCDLCVAPCPVDCITMIPVTGDKTGWDAWTQAQADAARERHARRAARLARERDAAERRAAARLANAGPAASPRGATAAGDARGVSDMAGTGEAATGNVAGTGGAARTAADAPSRVPAGGAPLPLVDTGATATAAGADDAQARKRAIIEAALERARKKKEELAAQGMGPKNVTNVSPAVQAQIEAAEARRKRLRLDAPQRPAEHDTAGSDRASAARGTHETTDKDDTGSTPAADGAARDPGHTGR